MLFYVYNYLIIIIIISLQENKQLASKFLRGPFTDATSVG